MNFCFTKEIKTIKKQTTDGEKIFAIIYPTKNLYPEYVSSGYIYPEYIKNPQNLIVRKQRTQLPNRQKT